MNEAQACWRWWKYLRLHWEKHNLMQHISYIYSPAHHVYFWEFIILIFLWHFKLPVLLPNAALSCHSVSNSLAFLSTVKPSVSLISQMPPFIYSISMLVWLFVFWLIIYVSTCNNCTKRLVFLYWKGKSTLSRSKTISIYCFIVSCPINFGTLPTMAWKILTRTVCCLWWVIKMRWGAY